jgi:heme A synthase
MTIGAERAESPAPEPSPAGHPHDRLRPLGLGFAALAAVTYALVVLGALVRANHAGLACPDWPLCFGQLVPEIDMRVGFEFGHRVLASLVSLGFVAGAVGVFRSPEARSRVGRWIGLAAALLVVQIVLGGLTVLELLASWTVTSHLLTGNAFALAVALIAHRLLRERPETASPAAVRTLLALAAAALVLQITLGGLVSSTYSGLVCPDWPTCVNGVWVPSWTGPQGLQVIHRLNAYLLVSLVAASLALARRRASPHLARLLAIALCIVLAQTAVGVANVLLRLPVEVTGAHSALAAALCLVVGLGVHDAFGGRGRAAR